MAKKMDPLTKNEFKQEVDAFFAAVNEQINFGKQWQIKQNKYLINKIKSSVDANAKYATDNKIKFNKKLLLAALTKYASAEWGLAETKNEAKSTAALNEFNKIINSIKNEEFKTHLSSWPEKIKKIIDPMKNQRLEYTDVDTGQICTSMTEYLKTKPTFHSYIRQITHDNYSVVTSVLMTIMESYFPDFDSKTTKAKLKAIKKTNINQYTRHGLKIGIKQNIHQPQTSGSF